MFHTRTHTRCRPTCRWAFLETWVVGRLQTSPHYKRPSDSPRCKKKKKKSTLGFYHKCFIISLRGGLAWSPVSAVVCVCARTCARRSWRTPAVLWQTVLVFQLVSVFVLGRCSRPINHKSLFNLCIPNNDIINISRLIKKRTSFQLPSVFLSLMWRESEPAGLCSRDGGGGTEGFDTEKERIICLIHERLWFKCPIVPPSATTNGPLSPSPLFPSPFSSLSVLSVPTSLTVLIFLCRPSPPLVPVSHPPPFLSLPLYPQLISSSCLICCPFQFNFFQPWLLPNATSPACLHTCARFLSSVPLHLHVSLSLCCLSVCLSLSGVGSALPSPLQCLLSVLRVKLTSRGHFDLSYHFSGITSHLFIRVSDAKKAVSLHLVAARLSCITRWDDATMKKTPPPPPWYLNVFL